MKLDGSNDTWKDLISVGKAATYSPRKSIVVKQHKSQKQEQLKQLVMQIVSNMGYDPFDGASVCTRLQDANRKRSEKPQQWWIRWGPGTLQAWKS